MWNTTLTRLLRVEKPFILAPMLRTSGGKLAASVASAGGFGLIGAAEQSTTWVEQQWMEAKGQLERERKSSLLNNIGFGFLGFMFDKQKEQIDYVITECRASAIWLSFSITKDQIRYIQKKSGEQQVKIIVQAQTIEEAKQAVDWGCDVVVLQGCDAGGHGRQHLSSSLFCLVPEVADYIRNQEKSEQVALVAAGGIVDERGIAAALMLGASGVVMGTRFVATPEANISEERKERIVECENGDTMTQPTNVFDQLFKPSVWPAMYVGRAISNTTYTELVASPTILKRPLTEDDFIIAKQAEQQGDLTRIVTWSGSAVGCIHSIVPAATLLEQLFDRTLFLLMNTRSLFSGPSS